MGVIKKYMMICGVVLADLHLLGMHGFSSRDGFMRLLWFMAFLMVMEQLVKILTVSALNI
jgi:hypothetical protein